MNSNPKEINAHLSLLMEEFKRKGYQCREVKETHSTIVYLSHDKKIPPTYEHSTEPPGLKKFLGF
ncbi:MAG: hypothetical protein ACXWV9_11335 [Flavisolibacter sp.]